MIVVWITIFICVCRGVKVSSKVVWITVPGPVLFIIIMVLNNMTLQGSDRGYRMYLKGTEISVDKATGEVTESSPDFGMMISRAAMWSDACSQIFFSIGVCLGVMISYASYNPDNQPVISNSIYVAGGNSLFSFVAGFAVFGVVGYLNEIGSPVSDKVSSNGLAFIAYPAAIETMFWPNFWTLMLASCLFMLGIDSAFSFIEGAATIVTDSRWAAEKGWSKLGITVTLCVIGAIGSTLFCFNWGFTLFDVVDYYLMNYCVLLMGILQAVACTWYYGYDDALKVAGSKGRSSVYALVYGYWIVMPLLGVLAYFVFPQSSWISIPLWWVLFVVIALISFLLARSAGMTFEHWYNHIYFYGARNLSQKMIALHES